LAERPGIQWLYACKSAGLSRDELAHMRIDQAEALIELSQFVTHSAFAEEDNKRAAASEAAFFG